MGKESVIAVKEDLKGITIEEKNAVDSYVEAVKKSMTSMARAVDTMCAAGDTMTDLRGVLQTDFENLNDDLKKLESLSKQLQEKADGYQRFIDALRGKK